MRDNLGDVRLIMGREIRVRMRQKSFVVSFLLVLGAIVLGAGLPGLLRSDGPTTYDVGLVGAATSLAGPLRDTARAADADIEIITSDYAEVAQARRAVTAGTIDVAVAGDQLIVEEEAPARLAPILVAAVQADRIAAAVAEGSLSAEAAAGVVGAAGLEVIALDPPDSDRDRRLALTYAGIVILYVQIMGFGVWVANGVVEEKSSRVIEVLLSKVTPASVLSGKIAGIGALGLAQLLAFLVVGLSVASATGTVDLPPGWLSASAGMVGWFLLGYLVYSCAFAVAGSLVSGQEELQNTILPMTFLLVASFFMAVAALGNPEGWIAVVGSFLPPSAPLVMPVRVAAGTAPGWQIGLSVVSTLLAAAAMVAVAGRVYAGGALRFGPKLKLREAWQGSAAATKD